MTAIACPHCQYVNEIDGAKPGQTVQCIACDGAFDFTGAPVASTRTPLRRKLEEIVEAEAWIEPRPSILASDAFDAEDANAQVVAVLERIEALLKKQATRVKRLHWLAVFFAAFWVLGVIFFTFAAILAAGTGDFFTFGVALATWFAIVIAAALAEYRN